MTNSCTTLPILGYYINITFMNGTNRNYTYTSRFVNATEGDSMGMFTFYYSQLFEEMLLPNTRYVLTVVPTDTDGKLLILYTCMIFCVLIFNASSHSRMQIKQALALKNAVLKPRAHRPLAGVHLVS